MDDVKIVITDPESVLLIVIVVQETMIDVKVVDLIVVVKSMDLVIRVVTLETRVLLRGQSLRV